MIRPLYKHAALVLAGASCAMLAAQTNSVTAVPAPLPLAVVAPVMECPAMASTDVSQSVGTPVEITSAAVVDDGKNSPYCKLQIVVDKFAHLELHLPTSAWTQRLLFGGGPGAQVATGMKLDQFVTASWQDLGHRVVARTRVSCTDLQWRSTKPLCGTGSKSSGLQSGFSCSELNRTAE